MYEVPEEVLVELREWRRHGVKVTEDCERCGGSREIPMREDTQGDFTEPCPDCDGIGKQLRDGVVDKMAEELDNGVKAGPFAWRQNEAGRLLRAAFAEWLEAE